MKAFTELYGALDATTKTTARRQRRSETTLPAHQATMQAWAIYFLIGAGHVSLCLRVSSAVAAEAANIPPWLFQESYDAVGDVAEYHRPALATDEAFKRSRPELLD